MSPSKAVAGSSKILYCDPSSISFPDDAKLPTISDATTQAHLEHAAAALRENKLVAFPTETVYGLGGSAVASSSAIPKIYQCKGRPSDNPLIVHISHPDQLDSIVDPAFKDDLPSCYPILMKEFWPGPLTFLIPTRPGQYISERVTCGLTTVGVRIPSHPIARALIAMADCPVAAPSANTSGRPSPTLARHVQTDLEGQEHLACILDGGPCAVGLESTVVTALRSDKAKGKQREHNGELQEEVLRVLRLGGISSEQLQAALDKAGLSKRVSLRIEADQGAHTLSNGDNHKQDFIPSTPGMKYKHYSPNAKVVLLRLVEERSARRLSEVLKPYASSRVGLIHVMESRLLAALQEVPSAQKVCFGDADDYQAQAQALFGALRSLDEENVEVILVESIKEEGLGRTVMERLRKSAGGQDVIDVCM